MNYQNEHLLPGQLGHFLVLLSFVAALLAMVAYFFSTQKRADAGAESSWKKIGRWSFGIHGLATFGVIGCLFFLLGNKYYEYHYAWANVSDDLPQEYIFSAFWKEQQGSFLLWMFWHIVLGGVLIWKAKTWESPVLAVISAIQVVISSMILGLYTPLGKIGATPFALLRDIMNAPIFQQADYLSKISGNGLNPLLQNYWMTIHPPTLFLGFASGAVPFAFTIAALWTKNYRDGLRAVLPWSLFSGAILGLGILMGGAWAYEALTFQGYWAWDPVENMSLVPWIVLVAGIHTNLVVRATGYSAKSTFLFYILSFCLLLYSTFLTRSGILGDTSAHAFTEMGLGPQLVFLIFIFLVPGLILWAMRLKSIESPKEEEAGASREFWMFLGSLVLMFSAILITGSTSLPVWNKIVQAFDPNYAGAVIKDQAEHHNRYQLWIGVFMGILSAIGQFFRFSEKNWAAWRSKFLKHVGGSALAAAALTAGALQIINANAWQYWTLLFAGIFTLVANLDYLVFFLRKNLKAAGSAVSHLGFGVLILGIMATGLNRYHISVNKFFMSGLIEGFTEDDEKKNVTLLREAPMPMARGWEATYSGDTIERQTRFFHIDFRQMDSLGKYTGEQFRVSPNVMYDRAFTKVAASNPSTRHYWTKDIFTSIAALPPSQIDAESAKSAEDSLKYRRFEGKIGDTIFTERHFVVLESLEKQGRSHDYAPMPGDISFKANLIFGTKDTSKTWRAAPLIVFRQNQVATFPEQLNELGVKVGISSELSERVFDLKNRLVFKNFDLKKGETVVFNGHQIRFADVSREVSNPLYQPEEGDIAVSAALEITSPGGKKSVAAPVYLIRGNRQFNLKDEILGEGLHFQFLKIDPATDKMTIAVAQSALADRLIPLEIAENVRRNDFLVLEAVVIPGIKLVWLGSLLMLFGLAIALFRRLFQ